MGRCGASRVPKCTLQFQGNRRRRCPESGHGVRVGALSGKLRKAMKTLRIALLAGLPLLLAAQSADQLKELRFRLIGPFRGGRAVAVAGVPSQPNVYYFGATGGGVWKTTDSGS